MKNFIITKYYSGDKIEEGEMSGAWGPYGGEFCRTEPVARTGHRWRDSIKSGPEIAFGKLGIDVTVTASCE